MYMTALSTRQEPECGGGLTERDHLGVCRGVRTQLSLVVPGSDHLAVEDDHGADRNVVVLRRAHRPPAGPGA